MSKFVESQHPRDSRGRFINAPDIIELVDGLRSIGGVFDFDSRTWQVPIEREPELNTILQRYESEGGDMTRPVGLPPALRPASSEDRKRAGIPRGYPGAYVPAEGDRNGLVGVGVDAKGRVKRFYSAEFQEGQARRKFERVRRLSKQLSSLDGRLPGDAERDDAAAAILLIRATGLRPGSDRDTGADKQAFGATTLRVRHVTINSDGTATLRFTGKGGKDLEIAVGDPDATRMLQGRINGREPDDRLFETSPAAAGDYLKRVVGTDFKPKDLRTALATSMAHGLVVGMPVPGSVAAARRARRQIAEAVSEQLGNTPAEALKSYIDPTVFAGWPVE